MLVQGEEGFLLQWRTRLGVVSSDWSHSRLERGERATYARRWNQKRVSVGRGALTVCAPRCPAGLVALVWSPRLGARTVTLRGEERREGGGGARSVAAGERQPNVQGCGAVNGGLPANGMTRTEATRGMAGCAKHAGLAPHALRIWGGGSGTERRHTSGR